MIPSYSLKCISNGEKGKKTEKRTEILTGVNIIFVVIVFVNDKFKHWANAH